MSSPRRPGFAVWFTGLPASGKSTLARAVQSRLAAQGIDAVCLDSDDLRAVLTPSPTYDETERDWFYAAIVYLASWLARSGVNVLIAATGNRRRYRQQAREQITRFAEVYVRCELAVCRQRDPKGLYAQAATGDASTIPGAGTAYEPPESPEVVVDTDRLYPEEAADLVIAQLCIWWSDSAAPR